MAVDAASPHLASDRTAERSRLSARDEALLRLQRALSWCFLVPLNIFLVAIIRFKFRLRVENHRQIRRAFREYVRRGTPIIICPNHLTLVDSVVIIWALASTWHYVFSYRSFCWNIPAIENYKSKPTWRVITYLCKCIPIDRVGSREHIDGILLKLMCLLRQGEMCMIFPEGTRSRSGRIETENVAYGVGKMLQEVPEAEVLCVYQRGLGQVSYSDFPAKGERIHVELALLKPQSSAAGRRAAKECSLQVIAKLQEMEGRYFARQAANNR